MSSADQSSSYGDRTAAQLLTDHRERLVFEAEERARQRTRQYEEIRSEFSSVSARIRTWEKMHGLRLPTSPAHPILEVIAAATGVSLADLREEQQLRRARPAPPSAGDAAAGG
jgi:hypothetical protein